MSRLRSHAVGPASSGPHGPAAADLPGPEVDGPTPEHVVACPVPLQDPNLERAARGLRGPHPHEHEVVVVADPDPPRVTHAVLVDLVLDLDPAVLLAELELPVAGAAA